MRDLVVNKVFVTSLIIGFVVGTAVGCIVRDNDGFVGETDGNKVGTTDVFVAEFETNKKSLGDIVGDTKGESVERTVGCTNAAVGY